MKSSLVVLLLVSLAGNAALAVFAFRRPAAAPTPTDRSAAIATSAPATSSTPAPAVANPPAPAPVDWQTLKPDANRHGLVANLRAAGLPPAVVRAVVNQMITDRLTGAGTDHLPFWKQNFGNPEYVAAQQQQSIQRREMLAELLGPDARPSASLDAATRERRFGSLSDEKIDQIENLTREYGELRTQLFAERKSGDGQNIMAAQAAVEQEQRAELATFLTPAELEQYEMRSSQSANRLMSSLRGVDVNEAEYAMLFHAQKTFDAADPLRAGVANSDAMIQRNAAQDVLNEQARAVLTDDRFYEYLKGADANYARTAQFAANHPSITPAMTYELTRIEREYQSTMMAASRGAPGGSPPSADRMAQLTAARKDYQDRINALLGPETAAAYAQRNRSGVIISSPAVRVGP
ncbi:MAG: hypothetical protein HYV75_09705 [Opitutae bacterium]|nr:hypothetical protein [Opitutae bacterium]